MNSIISFTHLRPLIANSLLKRTANVRPVLHKSLFSQYVTKKPKMSFVGQTMQSSIIPKRYMSGVSSKVSDLGDSHANHSHVWMVERLTAVGSVTSFIAMFLHPCENGELFFVLMASTHLHFGLEAIMIDYLRPAVVGNLLPKLIPFLTFAASGSMLALLAWVAMYGNGIAGSLQQLWYLNPIKEPYSPEDSKLRPPSQEI